MPEKSNFSHFQKNQTIYYDIQPLKKFVPCGEQGTERKLLRASLLNIVSRFRIHPATNTNCINPHLTELVQTKEGAKMISTCQSLRCPEHAHITRKEWAIRIEREIKRSKFNYSITMPIGDLIMQSDLSNLWSGFYNSLYYKLKNFRYCAILEMQDNFLHVHGVIHTDAEINPEVIKQCWKKYLSKKLKLQTDEARCQVKEYASPRDTAEYMMKTGNHVKEIQLPPKGLWHRQIFSSTHYGR